MNQSIHPQRLDVVIVGAGPAGIGMALELQKLPGLYCAMLEKGEVGESFRRWPAQTRLITPSFNSSPFGLADLNAVDAYSSPAIHAGIEHLSGEQYADYLGFVAEQYDLPITPRCTVQRVTPEGGEGFLVKTDKGSLRTRLLIWATGEFQFPELKPFPGGELCSHYARVKDWQTFQAPSYTVIGGYESGIDTAVNLIRLGRSVRLLSRRKTWDLPEVHDPSIALSPYSRGRLDEALCTGRLTTVFGVDVMAVDARGDGQFRIHAADGRYWDDPQPPILGTGFVKGGGARQITDLWGWNEAGQIILTPSDESTRTPGLFLVGPQVRQDNRIFCFIYKFRQRFNQIAHRIAEQLELDPDELQSGAWGAFGNNECCEGCEC